MKENATRQKSFVRGESAFDQLPDAQKAGFVERYGWTDENVPKTARFAADKATKLSFNQKSIRLATPERDADVIGRVSYLCGESGIAKVPPIWIADAPIINAASLPFHTIVFTTKILDVMSPAELDAVIGHELTHHKYRSRDEVRMSGSGVAANVGAHMTAGVSLLKKAAEIKNSAVRFIAKIGVWVAEFQVGLAPIAYLRYNNEYEADQGGAKVAGADNMADALETLGEQSKKIQENTPADKKPTLTRKLLGKLAYPYPTHPETDKRVGVLRKQSTQDAPATMVEEPQENGVVDEKSPEHIHHA